MTEYERNLNILTEQPVPEISPVQLQEFNLESLLASRQVELNYFKRQ